jgi:hypothetical protein
MQAIKRPSRRVDTLSANGDEPPEGSRRFFWQGNMTGAFWKFATLFSFVVNFILVVVLLVVVGLLFQIKNAIALPLVGGLHDSFVEMDNASIVTTIQVSDRLPVQFDLPLHQSTIVTTTQPVLITGASVNIQGGILTLSNAPTTILLPVGTALPVELNLTVPVSQTVPVNLTVPVSIPLNQTQLHTPFNRLRSLFFPYADALDKAPSSWGELLSPSR